MARHEGKICFIPGVLPGETVDAEITRDRGDFCEARALSILEPSPARITTVCPLTLSIPTGNRRHPAANTAICPGCCYQHMTYDQELQTKHAHLCQLLERHAPGAAALCLPPVASPLTLGYRNKMALHAQRDGSDLRLGYFMEDNQTIVDVQACPLAMDPLNSVLAERRQSASFMHGLRDGMTLTFRWTARDGAVWWRGRAAEKDVWLVEESIVGPLSVPRNSFYQTNPAVAHLLVGEVSRLLAADRPGRVVDLYCGVGIFALAAAQQGVPQVIGLDVDGPALKAAEYNAGKLGLTNIQWSAGSAHKTSISSLGGKRRPGGCIPRIGKEPDTTVIVDPPRTGLGRAMVSELAKLAPTSLLYISCAADTMARDAAWLKESGYTLRHSRVFDMFPRTPHFESLTEFTVNHFP